MTIANIALLAVFVMLAVATIDAVRGRTGLGKFRLSKTDEDPTRFWFAIVLYINMAIGMFWLAGQVRDDAPQESADAPAVTTTRASA
ncbi:hypothetical protein [Alteriqipengyuania lutimaris]|uniref:Uncharacterized protein n=1 Tax=Alteriqipengyuania lutimaris TaxID=1538146 RepID=A0A395LHR2_9SPHN|nr:hypothetical protein [Alteriqipengyuania lutimaris]MBB3034994.1 hypothetical protein [Alteriqipengyuania lutimaris]RDS76191.1 hypothetical protein DL238_00200 [Alteriqipengyuania lutimaris]